MPQELSAGPVTLLQLFKGEREYVSPLFQRQFVWGSTELTRLWEDIDEILDGRETTRFLGALVLEVKSAGLAFQPDSSWIVDGQQRLTTLYVTMLRIASEAEKAGATDLSNSIYRQYLFNQDGAHKDRPKLLPTLLDYQQFNALFEGVDAVSPRLKPPFGAKDGQLQKANRVIQREVRKRCRIDGKFDVEVAKRVVSTLLENLKFVQIVLGDAQDPHQVFDSLNAQGVRLENKDLIRNIVFQRLADDPAAAEVLYHAKWVPFEQELSDRLDGYFFPFALVHRSSVTKSTLLSTLRDRWSTFSPEQIVADLRTFVPTYNALTVATATARDGASESENVNLHLARLNRMPVPTSVYPFCFSLLRSFTQGEISEAWAVANLRQIESFLVRRAVAGFEPTGLHAVFKDLWAKTNGDPKKFVSEIDANPTVQYPDDNQFAQDIRAKPLYGRRLAKYIVGEYERGLEGGDPFHGVEPTLDHVMPQELTDLWRAIVTEEDHKALKDTWANIVPLSGPANSEKGQQTWEQIRTYLLTDTVFKTTKRLAQANEKWDASTIRARAEQLVQWALVRWPKSAS